jgi:hypothetical protein
MTNITDNVFLPVEKAGKDVAKAQQKAGREVLNIAITTIKSNVYTEEDAKHFLDGYAEQMATTNKDSVKTLKSRMARIVKVMLASDKKLNEFHKLSKPADGQKLVDKLSKQCDGILPLYKALAVPSAGKAEGEGDGEGEGSEPTAKEAKDLPTLYAEFMGEALNNGHTKDEIATFIASLNLSA